MFIYLFTGKNGISTASVCKIFGSRLSDDVTDRILPLIKFLSESECMFLVVAKTGLHQLLQMLS